jgi:amino acid adenylation domain-containing protein
MRDYLDQQGGEPVSGNDESESEAVAIIAMAGRFPGARSIAEFWDNIKAGRESLSTFTDEQLLRSGIGPESFNNADYVRSRGVLEDADQFDADFFDITPREAEMMDPQHRLFLETAWEALESAGYSADRTTGMIGVYAGCSLNTYLLSNICGDRAKVVDLVATYQIDNYQTLLGNDKDYLPTRVSYKLNLTGPSVSVQCACSTSLVAICHAVSALLGYQCDMALAGGVSVTFPQERGYLHQPGGLASGDGHCRPFDADASGTVFGAGVGVLVLKRLSEAIASDDRIVAVIKGVGVNNDGASKVSYMAPSVDGQANAISQAHALAGVSPDTITYVETHGTATPLGDPIEIAALTRAFRLGTDRVGYCAIGSVKGNIGHLEVASGVAGLIKTALALRDKVLPPSINYTAPNPRIPFGETPFVVNTQLRPWEGNGHPRRAGVSSFGVGGTNAHVVLEEAPERGPSEPGRQANTTVLSAKSDDALQQMSGRLATYIELNSCVPIDDVAYTLQVGRSLFDHRRAVTAIDRAQIVADLRSPGAGTTRYDKHRKRPVAFLFPGQGAQHPNMARSLYASEPLFRDEIDHCAKLLQGPLGFDLRTVLYPEVSDKENAAFQLDQTWITQPAIFSVEYALAKLWMGWGVVPSAMIGHSIGEYVAAAISGVFSLADALMIVGRRARMMQNLPAGGMLAIRLPANDVVEMLTPELSLAADNSPNLCVVSGPTIALDLLEERVTSSGGVARKLHTSHAFHSSMMDPILGDYANVVAQAGVGAATIPYVSNLTADWATEREFGDPGYWSRHMRNPVRFREGLAVLLAADDYALIEVGPGQVLSQVARQHSALTENQCVIPSLPPSAASMDDEVGISDALGNLWAAGGKIDWDSVHGGRARNRVELPTYPFSRQKHWVNPRNEVSTVVDREESRRIPVQNSDNLLTSPMSGKLPASIETDQSASDGRGSRASRLAVEITDVVASLSGLSASRIDPNARFLEIGLDSLFLTQAAQALHKHFGQRITFRDLIEDLPTVTAIASYLDKKLPADSPEPASAILPDAQLKTAPVQSGSDQTLVERVINSQLQVMAEQLAILRGASLPVTGLPAAGGATASALPAPKPGRFGPYKPIEPNHSGTLSPLQASALHDLISRYVARTKKSKKLTADTRRYLADPRVVAGFKNIWKEMVYPIVSERSCGSHIWDIDGNQYVDLTMGFGVNMFGHSPEWVTNAVRQQLELGVEIGPQSPIAGEVARRISAATGMERVTFCNTGSEAVTAALRVARTVSGRDKMVMFAGSYHGTSDEVLARPGADGASFPVAPGIPRTAVSNVLVLPYGTDEALEVISRETSNLAAVLVEPVQSRRPDLQPREFLQKVREVTRTSETALIFDEVITGFRSHLGGAQAVFDIRADLATYGKVIGGGMPFGALAGSAKYMDAFDGGMWQYGDSSFPEVGVTFFAGTFVRHPLALAAANVVLQHLADCGPSLQDNLSKSVSTFAEELNAFLSNRDAPFKIAYFSSFFYFKFDPEWKWSSLLFFYLREKGVHLWEGRPCFFSTAHSEEDIALVRSAFKQTVIEMERGGFIVSRAPKIPESDVPSDPSPNEGLALSNGHKGDLPNGLHDVPVANGDVNAETRICDVSAPVLGNPLTSEQREIWLAAQMGDDASCSFNESLSVTLRGNLNEQFLREAAQSLIDRHEALRTTFSPDGAAQLVSVTALIDWQIDELAGEDDPSRALRLIQEAEGTFPFDLTVGPLIRFRLASLSSEHHVLIVTAHHIVCDGWSFGNLVRELATIYTSLATGATISLQNPVPFSRFAAQELLLSSVEAREGAEQYWRDQLAGYDGGLHLPTDRARPPVHTYAGMRVSRAIPEAIVDDVRSIAASSGCTVFSALFATYALLLSRLTGQNDLVVGIPVAGQALENQETLVGHCVRLLPVRVSINEEQTVADVLRAFQSVLLDAYEHQGVTFGQLVEHMNVHRDLSHVMLIDAVFNIDKPPQDVCFSGLEHSVSANPISFYQFDIGFNLVENDGKLDIECSFNTDLFNASTVERWLRHYLTLLANISERADLPVKNVEILTPGERREIVELWNDTTTDYPRDLPIHRVFEKTSATYPDSVAVVAGLQSLKYGELDARANILAERLVSAGVRPGQPVGILVERSLDEIVGLLAILKAGAAYVPLEAEWPAERKNLILADCGVRTLLLQSAAVLKGIHSSVSVVSIAGCASSLAAPRGDYASVSVDPLDMAYVMYTSGSTGRPKGVKISHRAVNRLVTGTDYVELGPSHVVLHAAPLSFDASTFEIWGALLTGAKLVLMPQGTPALQDIGDTIKHNGVTTAWMTASLFHAAVDHILDAIVPLRQLLAGGDVLLPSYVRRFIVAAPHCRLINGYGPTENTTFTCCATLTEDVLDEDRVPIGRPIANTTAYVLDRLMRPVSIGVTGELFTGGDGLAIGIVGVDCNDRFVPNPFVVGTRLYRTGDLARYRANGLIDFIGRSDCQVKLRGYRVEPGEIETALCAIEGILQAVVLVREMSDGDKKLEAFATQASGQQLTEQGVLRALRASLPAYMVPSRLHMVDSIPLTPNGKPDRHALLSVSAEVVAPANSREETETERELAHIWCEVLNVSNFERDDSFFDLGGHSLQAVRAVVEIERRLGKRISLSSFYQASTIRGLGHLIQDPMPAHASLVFPIASEGTRPPLFCCHHIDGTAVCYRELAHYLPADQPVYGVQAMGLSGQCEPESDIEAMAARYAADVIATFPSGPFRLCGLSFGGTVAFEMAQQLVKLGHIVDFVGLIDTYGPAYFRSPSASEKQSSILSRAFDQIYAFHRLEGIGRRKLVETKAKSALKRIRGALPGGAEHEKELSGFLPERLESVRLANEQAQRSYYPQVYPGKLVLFRAKERLDRTYYDRAMSWGGLAAGGLEIREVLGNHYTIIQEPFVSGLANVIAACIEAIDRDARHDQ